MTALAGFLSDGSALVLGVEHITLARSIMIEAMIERGDLDNTGICEVWQESGYCDLATSDLCEACRGFLNDIFPIEKAESYPAFYWKEI